MKDGDTFQIGNINVKVLFTPCHTSGHVLYLCNQAGEEVALFSLLFSFFFLFISSFFLSFYYVDFCLPSHFPHYRRARCSQEIHSLLGDVGGSLKEQRIKCTTL